MASGKWLVASGFLIMMLSCANKPASSVYFSESKEAVLPDSARVKAVVAVQQGDKKEKLSTVLFAVPGEKYRLEISSSFGFSAASILWKRDGWRIIFPQEERYMEGAGDYIFLPVYGGVDIHKFSLLFFGQRVEMENFTLEYKDNMVLIISGSDSMQLEIKDINPKAEWGSGVWNLNVPEKYIRSEW